MNADTWTVRLVAFLLGLAALYALYLKNDVATGTALGALAGFLAGVPVHVKKD